MDVRSFVVGPVAENTYLLRRDGGTSALLVDPGAEPERLISAVEELGVTVEAILLTHTHYDHIGAVAAMHRHTGAPVYCPKGEAMVLAEPNRYMRIPGLPEIEGYVADVLLGGGERLELAGFAIDVLSTPGHSIDHMTFLIADEGAIFSGDVLFEGSIGRYDLPGGDLGTLMTSIAELLERLAPETVVYPGHMGVTTLGRERATNPFLQDLPDRR